ncbi:hypothetical protein CHS0354_021369 [Potamilus streckersoni]|uniref:Uncharacterized protein n=1 Tax=Potamilus streckersoni TaxID=2493646 RepID=A0AAE0S3M5_9BIVA|nr:hypothetical protein CHS0354_021369 [Potamilus streckersoni]
MRICVKFINKSLLHWFKNTTSKTTVPDNSTARLMYYLHCMCTVVDLTDTSPNLQRLRNYANYYLTSDEKERLIILCLLLDPDVFINKCILQVDALCQNFDNEFYEITPVNNHLLVAGNVIVAGQNRRVNKIMAFKTEWIAKYYYTPLNALLQQRQMRRQNDALACTIS